MQPTVLSELAKAVPVVLGALLAILGGIIGQLLSHRLVRSRDRGSLRRERIEGLVKALYEHSQWIKDKQAAVLFRDQELDSPSPLAEAEMLQRLYFPELGPEILAVLEAELEIIKFINEQQIAKLKDRRAWVETWNPQPFYDAYKKYLKALNATVTKCRDQIAPYIKP